MPRTVLCASFFGSDLGARLHWIFEVGAPNRLARSIWFTSFYFRFIRDYYTSTNTSTINPKSNMRTMDGWYYRINTLLTLHTVFFSSQFFCPFNGILICSHHLTWPLHNKHLSSPGICLYRNLFQYFVVVMAFVWWIYQIQYCVNNIGNVAMFLNQIVSM